MNSHLTPVQDAIRLLPPTTVSVFAAPGSGKTTVLTEHILHQLQTRSLDPREIMAVTFTKQAAAEMKNRLHHGQGHLAMNKVNALRVGTFHAQMFSVLLNAMPNIPVLLDPREQFQVARTALQLQSLPDSTEDTRRMMTALSRLRAEWPPQPTTRRLKRFVQQYERLKARHHRWDFDDILVTACKFLESDTRKLQLGPLQYLLVDEFQDTNPVQWQIARYIVETQRAKLFVVGDDDQSIYGFRGANPQWLVHFNRWFPGALRFQMEINFRSDVEIVNASNLLIKHNVLRQAKAIRGASERAGEAMFCRHATESEEASSVSGIASTSAGLTQAVLARTRKQLEKTWTILPPHLRQRVQFRTFHDAKGKEWDVVHIVGAVANNPYLKTSSIAAVDSEEERRTFYVAMTRAKRMLYIHQPTTIANKRFKPLDYIEETGILQNRRCR